MSLIEMLDEMSDEEKKELIHQLERAKEVSINYVREKIINYSPTKNPPIRGKFIKENPHTKKEKKNFLLNFEEIK